MPKKDKVSIKELEAKLAAKDKELEEMEAECDDCSTVNDCHDFLRVIIDSVNNIEKNTTRKEKKAIEVRTICQVVKDSINTFIKANVKNKGT